MKKKLGSGVLGKLLSGSMNRSIPSPLEGAGVQGRSGVQGKRLGSGSVNRAQSRPSEGSGVRG